MFHVFNLIPTGFFNNLASGSNQRIYSDCIQLIYKEYEREISYRIPRNRIRDTLAIYFLENHVELSHEEYCGDRTANDMAGYHNSEKQALLRWINKENLQKNWYHFGDIDPDGFYILEHLRKGTGINFEPLYMNVLELKKYAKYCKEMSGKDRVKAENLMKRKEK